MGQNRNTNFREDKDHGKQTVSQNEIDNVLTPYAGKLAACDEEEKERIRQQIKRIIEKFIVKMNNLLAPSIESLRKNTEEIAKLRELQKEDPHNPVYLKKEIELLNENARLMGEVISARDCLASYGFLFKGIEEKLPLNMDQQHTEINARLMELGQRPVPVRLSLMDEVSQTVKNFFEDLKPQKAIDAPKWMKDSIKEKVSVEEPEHTVSLGRGPR